MAMVLGMLGRISSRIPSLRCSSSLTVNAESRHAGPSNFAQKDCCD